MVGDYLVIDEAKEEENRKHTWYDSKLLNILYVDRSLELQGLIQAYSRTNRIYGKNKEFGTIVNFQYPRITKEIVDTALKLYGSGVKTDIPHKPSLPQVATFKIRTINEFSKSQKLKP